MTVKGTTKRQRYQSQVLEHEVVSTLEHDLFEEELTYCAVSDVPNHADCNPVVMGKTNDKVLTKKKTKNTLATTPMYLVNGDSKEKNTIRPKSVDRLYQPFEYTAQVNSHSFENHFIQEENQNSHVFLNRHEIESFYPPFEGRPPPPAKLVEEKFHQLMYFRFPLTSEETRYFSRLNMDGKWDAILAEKRREPSLNESEHVRRIREVLEEIPRNTTKWKPSKQSKVLYKMDKILILLKNDLLYSSQFFVDGFVRVEGLRRLNDLLKLFSGERFLEDISKNGEKQRLLELLLLCLHLLFQRCKISKDEFAYFEDSIENVIDIVLIKEWSLVTRVLLCLQILTEEMQCYERTVKHLQKPSTKYPSLGCVLDYLCSNAVRFSNQEHHIQQQIVIVTFFSELLKNAPSINQQVHLQEELRRGGLTVDKLSSYIIRLQNELSGEDDLIEELDEAAARFKTDCVDVQKIWDRANVAETRSEIMREEVGVLQSRLRATEGGLQTANQQIEQMKQVLEREQDRVRKLSLSTMSNVEPEHQQNDFSSKPQRFIRKGSKNKPFSKSLDNSAKSSISKSQSAEEVAATSEDDAEVFNSVSGADDVPSELAFSETRDAKHLHWPFSLRIPNPPSSVPPSIMTSESFYSSQSIYENFKHFQHPEVRLPLLHWEPLLRVEGTLFENCSEEALLQKLNFNILTKNFKICNDSSANETLQRRRILLDKLDKQTRFLDDKLSRNILITKRKLGSYDDEICHAIQICNTKIVPGEYAEILKNFLPKSHAESRTYLKHRNKMENLAEAEALLVKLLLIERVENKLSVMIFIDTYQDRVSEIMKALNDMLEVCHCVLNNSKALQNLLHIVLVLGNFLNSGRKRHCSGYKISSIAKLKEIRSTDKKFSMLDYIVTLLQKENNSSKSSSTSSTDNYLQTFISRFDFEVPKLSLKTLHTDLEQLKRGLALLREENQHLDSQRSRRYSIRSPQQADTSDDLTATSHLTDVYHTAERLIPNMLDYAKQMQLAYSQICCLLGEPPTVDPECTLGVISQLAKDLRQSRVIEAS